MRDGFDKKVNSTLNEISAPSEETLDAIWADIEKRIDFENKILSGENSMKRSEKKLRHKRRFIGIGAAAAFLIALLLTTPPANAMINQLFSFFGSSNSQDYYTEQSGSTKIDAPMYESKLGYITYYDNLYFDVTSTGGSDRFVPKEDNGKGSAQSSFEVKLLKDTTVEEAAAAAEKELRQRHSEVQTADKNDSGYFYLSNPFEGVTIQAYDTEPVSSNTGSLRGKKEGMLKKDSLIEFCSIGEIKGVGVVSISYRYNPYDSDTAWRMTKLYRDIVVVNDNTKKNMEQGQNLLAFNYDQSKYKLVQIRGEQYTYLSPADAKTFDPGILSVGHFYNKDMEKAAKEVEHWGDSEIRPTDISLKSIMLVSNDNHTKCYLIDDGQGGLFMLQFNVTSNEEIKKITDSLRIVPQIGNEELMNPEELQPDGLG